MAWQKGWRERTVDIDGDNLETVVEKAQHIINQEEFVTSLLDFSIATRQGAYYDDSSVVTLEYYTPPTEAELDNERRAKTHWEYQERQQYEALKKKFEGKE